jgi:hypothetical protein
MNNKTFLITVDEHDYYWMRNYIDRYQKGSYTDPKTHFTYIGFDPETNEIMRYSHPEYYKHKAGYDLAIEKLKQYQLLQ